MIEYHPEFENTQVTKKTEEKLMKTDILIVGTGCSGLYCALNIPEEKQITIITKKKAEAVYVYEEGKLILTPFLKIHLRLGTMKMTEIVSK